MINIFKTSCEISNVSIQVANIVGRTELMSALFFLLSLLSYQHLVAHKGRGPPRPLTSAAWFISTIVAATCSLLSKEQGVTVLGVCVAYDVFIVSKMNIEDVTTATRKGLKFKLSSWKAVLASPLGGSGFASLAKRVLLLVATTLLLLGLRYYINGGAPPMFVESDNPASFSPHMLTRGFTYMYLCAVNMWSMLAPSRLCFDWSMGSIPLVESIEDSRNFSTLAFFLFFVVVVVKAGESCDYHMIIMSSVVL